MAKELTLEDKKWIAEKNVMKEKFQTLMGYRIPIRDVPEDRAMYSYTSSEPAIYIKRDSEVTDGCTPSRKRRYRFGLFLSELLLVQFTDFNYEKTIESRLDMSESYIYSFIAQVIEKGSSRRYAASFIGGKYLQAYESVLKRITDILPSINKAETPFQELATAMLQIAYTDMLKGKFKTPEVKKVLKDVYPKLIKAIDCTNPEDRLDMAIGIMEDTKDIWGPAIDEAGKYSSIKGRAAYMSSLFGSALSGAISGFMGTGSGMEAPADEELDYSLGAKRESTWNKLNADESKEKAEKSDSSEKRKGGKNEEDKAEYDYDDEADFDLSTGKDEESDETEAELEADDFFDDLIQRELEIESSELSTTKRSGIPDFQAVAKKYKLKEYKRNDVIVTPKDAAKNLGIYENIIMNYGGELTKSYKELKKLFVDERSEEEYKTSGRISMKRVASGKVSSKLFTKTVEPEDMKSIALMIAVDQSGSMMSNGRIERAKAAAIGITEIFAKLDIPTYVMGFTADMDGYDAIHYHYTQWHTTTKMDRAAIASMDAEANNFDGYSIRCADAILDVRPETHKILMVISDGQPACRAYYSSSGYSDTKDAVQEARDKGHTVIGFGIGEDQDVLKAFYGDDFVHIDVLADLFKGMVDKFTSVVKSW